MTAPGVGGGRAAAATPSHPARPGYRSGSVRAGSVTGSEVP